MTARDETNCTGVLAKGGHGVGEPGNLCHVDCSNRGFCDHETGQCKCFQGFYGHNCHYKDALAVQIETVDGIFFVESCGVAAALPASKPLEDAA